MMEKVDSLRVVWDKTLDFSSLEEVEKGKDVEEEEDKFNARNIVAE
jgi:hypothetical protein